MFKYYVSKFSQIWTPPLHQHSIGELLDDFYYTFKIIKICFSINIRNIFLGALELHSRQLGHDSGIISLLMISSILQQYLLYVLTFPPLPFNVSAYQHSGLDLSTPLQMVSSVSILAQTPPLPNVLM